MNPTRRAECRLRRRNTALARSLDIGKGGSLPSWLFDESGGVQVSGDSGSGKSTFLCAIAAALARHGCGLTLFDPHGDLVRKVKRLCLNMGPSVVDRLYEICPGDTSLVTKFNPLAVDERGLDDYAWRARLTEKCGHAARILLHAWGERDFNSKPLLYKWVNRMLTAAALLHLPFAAVRHLLEVRSPLYQALTLAHPDFVTRLEFAELAHMRPREREELIASTKNRFLGFLSNPVVEAALSWDQGVDAGRLVQQRAIILVDLSRQNVLRPEDQEIFANLWLSEVLHAIFGMPEESRVPHWIIIDELPVFAACAPEITDALRQVRKFKTRFVPAHQGTNFFEKQRDDRLLHALVGQCGLHVYLRHSDPLDAKFFGEIVSLPSYSATRVKHVLRQRQQYQAGHRLMTLVDHSHGTSEGQESGGSESQGETRGETQGTDSSQTTSGQGMAGAESHGQSTSTGASRTSGSNWSRSQNRSVTRTWKQTLVPVLKWRDVITSITFLTPEEQTAGAAAILSRLQAGEALMYVAGTGVRKIRIPLLADPFASTPIFAEKKLTMFRQTLLRHSAYEEPAALQARETALMNSWLKKLWALAKSEDVVAPEFVEERQSGSLRSQEENPPSELTI